jgi:tripartite motif-containing protein 71
MKLLKILSAFILITLIISSCKKEKSGTADTLNWSYSTAFGSGGTGDGQFDLITGMAIDASGNVYTSDINQERVQKFNSSGTFITKWGSLGTGDGQFNWPRAIVANTDGSIEVADQNNCRVQKFTPGGVYLSQFGTCGTADGQFQHFYRMERDANGILYVIDPQNNRIEKFSAQRSHLLSWGYGYVFGDAQDIACSSTGDVYVAFDDYTSVPPKETIAQYNPSGTLINSWKVAIDDSIIGSIQSIDFDSQDNLHIGCGDGLIKIYKKDGTFIKQWGKLGSAQGEILSLSVIRFGPNDDLYIGGCSGNSNCRISKFTKAN